MSTICAVLIRDRNKDIVPNQRAFDITLLKSHKFLLIIGWAYFSTFGYTLVFFSLPDNALKIGLAVQHGAVAGALVNLDVTVGRPIVGYFSDHYGRINMIGGATFLCAIFCVSIWTSAATYASLLVFSFLRGTIVGTYWVVSCTTPRIAICWQAHSDNWPSSCGCNPLKHSLLPCLLCGL
jgi:MFS family permease